MIRFILNAIENGYMPYVMERAVVRTLIKQRYLSLSKSDIHQAQILHSQFIDKLKQSPIALVPEKANQQHYEVPAEFFNIALGKHKKYSSCIWKDNCLSLDQAEAEMLELSCERAELSNGVKILELGCGWGSLSLWMAEKYPNSEITSVSNSHSQKIFIDTEAQKRGLKNLTVITSDMNDFTSHQLYDRVVSIEMFEHMRNWPILLEKISSWLNPGGKLFIHIFCHKDTPYIFETEGAQNWMGRYFFSGGMMPAASTLLYMQDHFKVSRHWNVSGLHYQKTAKGWRDNLESHRAAAFSILREVYGEGNERLWYNRWRLFFMACEELFGFKNGNEWFVSHYLLERR